MTIKYYDNDTSLIFNDTYLFFLLILLVYISKFNVHDILMTVPLILALGGSQWKCRKNVMGIKFDNCTNITRREKKGVS